MAAKKKIKKLSPAKPKPKAKPALKSKSKAAPKSTVKAKAGSKSKPTTKAKKTIRPKPKKSTSAPIAAIVEVTEIVAIQIDHGAIAQRAYEIWESKGRLEGDGHQNWVEAEAQLRGAKKARR
jgi:hypothetical protein